MDPKLKKAVLVDADDRRLRYTIGVLAILDCCFVQDRLSKFGVQAAFL